MKLKKFISNPTAFRPIRALVVVVFFSAFTHVTLVFIMAIVHKQPGLINPLDILGVTTIFPQAKNSGWLSVLGWAMLAAAFVVILRIIVIRSRKKTSTDN